MGTAVEEAWARIEAWLARQAPRSFATLLDGADPSAIVKAETAVGLPFPSDLVASLRRHDGADDMDPASRWLPGGHSLLPVDEIVRRHAMLTEILADLDSFMVGHWWHPLWVPFGEHIAGDCLFVDQQPGPGQGGVREFMHEDQATKAEFPSFGEYLVAIAGAVEQRVPIRYYRPDVEDGALVWRIEGLPTWPIP